MNDPRDEVGDAPATPATSPETHHEAPSLEAESLVSAQQIIAPTASETSHEATPPDPSLTDEVTRRLLYGLSLPERLLRSASGVAAGAMREAAALIVPNAFRDGATYRVFVQQMLDFLAHDVGGVAREKGATGQPALENFVARKAVGNFVELAGLYTLRVSPILVLAVLCDVAHGSQTLLQEFAGELRRTGVIGPDATIDNVDSLLDAIRKSSDVAATSLAMPPLSVDELKKSVDAIRSSVASIDPSKLAPKAELEALWRDMRRLARQSNVGLMELSSALAIFSFDKLNTASSSALGGVRASSVLVDRHILDHYRHGMEGIRAQGFYPFLAKTSQPYIEAVWHNFSADKRTFSEDLLSGKLAGQAWTKVRGWLQESQGAPRDENA